MMPTPEIDFASWAPAHTSVPILNVIVIVLVVLVDCDTDRPFPAANV